MESPPEKPPQPEPPVRILVSTLTHLVPGRNSVERTDFILNRMCQYHWKCDFESPKFRWASYNDNFAFNNRRCFFLIDYGESENDEDIPILSYEWTGEALNPMPQIAKDPKIQAVLKEEVPFTPRPSKREKLPVREIVRLRLRRKDGIPQSELDHMREHTEDLQWLKAHVRPRLWQTFVEMVNECRPLDAPELEE